MLRRRKARELALQALYAQEMTGNSIEAVIEDLILLHGVEDKVKNFAVQLFKKGAEEKESADKRIMKQAYNWDFDRIAILDKLIMRMAICEFLYFEDIPPKVSIDEAIEIAKKYSTEKSSQFINGILDGILLDLNKQKLLKKSGRGLSDHKRDQ